MNNKYPRDWNENRIQKVINHYESQTEEEAVSEDEAAYEHDGQTIMEIPSELVPEVRDLIANNASTNSYNILNPTSESFAALRGRLLGGAD